MIRPELYRVPLAALDYIAELECALATREMEAKEYCQIIDSHVATIAELREAARVVVEEKKRLSTYLGGPVSIDVLNHRIKTLAALIEPPVGESDD